LLRRAEHGCDVIAAGEKCFEHRLPEILLPDNCDSHAAPRHFFEGAEKAPACFFAAISASLQPSTSFNMSRVCSPNIGDRSIFAGDAESLIGMPMLCHLPRSG